MIRANIFETNRDDKVNVTVEFSGLTRKEADKVEKRICDMLDKGLLGRGWIHDK